MIKSAKVCASTIKNSSGKAKRGMFAAVALLAVVVSISFTGTRIGYKVSVNGNMIATVSSKQHYEDALDIVSSKVNGNDVEGAVTKPDFSVAIVLDSDINNPSEIADAIISNTDEIVSASTLKVNGQAVTCIEKTQLESLVQNRLDSFNKDGNECNSKFVDTVEFEDAYYLKSELDSIENAMAAVNSLSVMTEMRQVTDVVVPYSSVVEKTNEQVIGYSQVTVAGVSGVNRVTQDVVMINGEIKSCVDVSTEVVVAPVNQVTVKGTAKTLASAKQKQVAHAAGFIFPLPDGTWRVSSYYGDGRNHKGVDICAKSGTSIYAVLDGTVVHSGWKGNYGYCVIVEHSNGMRTLYAHAKQLCCNVGDTVSQGEVIALVGTTGQSTGNHLHFEVIVNGRNMDPSPYINLD